MYRAWVEEVLGLKIRGMRMWLDPVIPSSWQGFGLRYSQGKSEYQIQVNNPDRVGQGVLWVEMNGERLSSKVIPLDGEEGRHHIVVRMGLA